MPKRNKKYNPNKHKQLNVERLLRPYLVCFMVGKHDEKCVLYDYRNGRIIDRPPPSVAMAIIHNPFKWVMHLGVFGRKENGQEYMECQILSSPNYYYQHELIKTYNEYHQEMISIFNKSRMLTAGWIGSTSGIELSEKEMTKIFAKLGAWDFE